MKISYEARFKWMDDEIVSLRNEFVKSKPVAVATASAIPTNTSQSTWANYLFKSIETPSVELWNVITAAKLEMRERTSKETTLLIFGVLEDSDHSDEIGDDNERVDKILLSVTADIEKPYTIRPLNLDSGSIFLFIKCDYSKVFEQAR
jgi:hypothetical protein